MEIQYLDTYYKLMFYKEYLTKQFNENHEYMNTIEINKYLKEIDLYSSLFKKEYDIKPNNKLDINDLNKYIYFIYNDLCILYKILNKLSIEKYNELKDYIDSNLESLDLTANLYAQRSQLELNSSYLGETLYYQDSGFDINNGIINLGDIKLNTNSDIACIISGTNLIKENIKFIFNDNDKILYAGPHNFYQTILHIPGNNKKNTYKINFADIEEDTLLDLNIQETIKEIKLNTKYIAYNGINKIKIADKITNEIHYMDITDNSTVNIPNNSYISFYAPAGSNIDFDYSTAPLYTNFDGTSIKDLKNDSKIILECPNNFILSIKPYQNIYAEKERCLVEENKILFPKYTLLNDFILEEIFDGEEIDYKCDVQILNNDASIDYIAIKKLIQN